MNRSLEEIEAAIAHERRALDDWLCIAYADKESGRYWPELDASYEGWGSIEALAGSIFDNRQVRLLGRESLDSVLFFISRGEEGGKIIAWLTSHEFKKLSHCGDLSCDDFVFLSEQAVMRGEDFCDYQFAKSFEKFTYLDDRSIDLLHKFFRKKDSYTRRVSLHALARFRHASVCELAHELWRTESCEFAKLSCLHVLREFPEGKSMFDEFLREYLELYDIDEADYRKSHIEALTGMQNP